MKIKKTYLISLFCLFASILYLGITSCDGEECSGTVHYCLHLNLTSSFPGCNGTIIPEDTIIKIVGGKQYTFYNTFPDVFCIDVPRTGGTQIQIDTWRLCTGPTILWEHCTFKYITNKCCNKQNVDVSCDVDNCSYQ